MQIIFAHTLHSPFPAYNNFEASRMQPSLKGHGAC